MNANARAALTACMTHPDFALFKLNLLHASMDGDLGGHKVGRCGFNHTLLFASTSPLLMVEPKAEDYPQQPSSQRHFASEVLHDIF